MIETAGTKLRRARKQRHLSIEDAARATKIRASQLDELENDDYSNFANLAYARGFLIAYGKYLQLDVRPFLDGFADTNTFGLDDYQYLSESSLGVYRAPARQWRRHRQTSVRQILMMAASVLTLTGAVFACYLYVNYKRLGNLDRLVDRQAVQTQVSRTDATAAPAERSGPGMVPVSSAPAPSAAAPARPDVLPTDDDNRAAASALAVTSHNNSPAALLTQLSLPALKSPVDGKSSANSNGGNTPLLVHAPDNKLDHYSAAVPKPQKVANTTLE